MCVCKLESTCADGLGGFLQYLLISVETLKSTKKCTFNFVAYYCFFVSLEKCPGRISNENKKRVTFA